MPVTAKFGACYSSLLEKSPLFNLRDKIFD